LAIQYDLYSLGRATPDDWRQHQFIRSSVSGAVHINGSNCFDPLNTISLTGTLTGSDLSLTSTAVDGQVTTLTGSISDNTQTATHLPGQFTGTYAIDGGCAGGDKGNVTGVKVSSMAGHVDEFDGVGKAMLLTPGQHRLRIALPGYLPFDTMVDLRPQQKLKIQTDLVKGSITEAGSQVSEQ